MRVTYLLQRDAGAWTFEAYVDWRCIMVGVNWEWEGWRGLRAFYIHVGPVIVGVHQWH